MTRYLELLVSRGRPLGLDDTWHAQLEAMLAAARGESAHRAVDRAMQDGLGITPPPKVDSMLAQVTGQLVTTVIREHTGSTDVRFDAASGPSAAPAPSAPPAEVMPPGGTTPRAGVIGFEGVSAAVRERSAVGGSHVSPVTVERCPAVTVGTAPVAMATAEVQTCAAGRGQKRHSATQTVRTMAAPVAAVSDSLSSSSESNISSGSGSGSGSDSGSSSSRSSSASSGCRAASPPSEDSGSVCDCAQCAARCQRPATVGAAAGTAETGKGKVGTAGAGSGARVPPVRRRNLRHRRRQRSLQAMRLSDRARFTEAVTV